MKKNLAILAVLAGVFLPGGKRLLAQDIPGPQSMKQDVRRSTSVSADARLPSDEDIQLLKKGLGS